MNQLRRLRGLFLPILLALLVGCAGTAQQESTGDYIDDTVLTTRVKAAVFNEPSLKSAEINVETFKGVVQLSGFVDNQTAVERAGVVARSVEGVTRVENKLTVK